MLTCVPFYGLRHTILVKLSGENTGAGDEALFQENCGTAASLEAYSICRIKNQPDRHIVGIGVSTGAEQVLIVVKTVGLLMFIR